MRKLIPAFAMLMVAAIMMTTASFAWFTMNETVTATGMQVQAKATGSLVISDDELTYNSAATEVDFSETAVKQLAPIHLEATKANGVITAVEWQKPESTAVVHPLTGKITFGQMAKVADSVAQASYFDKVVYIGTAGDNAIKSGNLTIDLSAIASAAGSATQAYSVAVYLKGVVTGEADSLGNVATNDVPVAIVHVDTTVTGRNTAEVALSETNYIPSIVGIGAQNTQVTGLKVVLRVFVEGNLESGTNDKMEVPTGVYTYATPAGTSYDSTKMYYYATGNYVEVTEDEKKAAVDGVIPAGWYVAGTTENTYTAATAGQPVVLATKYYVPEYAPADLNNMTNKQYDTTDPTKIVGGTIPSSWVIRTANTTEVTYNYINSKTENVPSSGSTLAVKFSTTLG